MPEQQPDKRCGTCEHFPHEAKIAVCPQIILRVGRMTDARRCPAWTPKPPKNPEEK